MGIKEFIKKIKTRMNKDIRNNYITYKIPKNYYKDLIKENEIENIINNMPNGLSNMEKAYNIYIELGKKISESPRYIFSNLAKKEAIYFDKIDKEYFGICKSISELYVSILKDKRIRIPAYLVKRHPESEISHIDTVIKIDGKYYLVNLISDLSRIKTSRSLNGFGIDLERPQDNELDELKNLSYLEKLEDYFGKIDCIDREDIEQMDKKLGYSYFVPEFTEKDDRGIYTDDTINLLIKEFNNPETFKKYVLQGKDVPKEDILKYKIDYLINNVNNFTDYNGKIEYLENIRYYLKIGQKLFSKEEGRRIHAYAATIDNNLSKIISIIKVDPVKKSEENNNLYYVYSDEERKYKEKTPEEMKEFLDGINRERIQIIGMVDYLDRQDIDELEL